MLPEFTKILWGGDTQSTSNHVQEKRHHPANGAPATAPDRDSRPGYLECMWAGGRGPGRQPELLLCPTCIPARQGQKSASPRSQEAGHVAAQS